MPLLVHVTLAPELAPPPFTSARAAVLLVAAALFQFGCATIPATSELPIAVPWPTNLMPIAAAAVTVTDSVTPALCVSAPLLPVMVSVELAAGVVALVLTVSVALPEPVTVEGEKLALAPAGSPLALSVTPPLKPFTAPMFIV